LNLGIGQRRAARELARQRERFVLQSVVGDDAIDEAGAERVLTAEHFGEHQRSAWRAPHPCAR
jgi:hypothetical protein